MLEKFHLVELPLHESDRTAPMNDADRDALAGDAREPANQGFAGELVADEPSVGDRHGNRRAEREELREDFENLAHGEPSMVWLKSNSQLN